MGAAEIRATRDGKSPATTGICSSSQFFDPTGFSYRLRDEKSLIYFHYKVYAHARQTKVTTLACEEFVRRFLMHTLPNGFVPIR